MMRTDKPTKTHYLLLRVVFDKPCDWKTALRAARYGLSKHTPVIPARAFASPYHYTDPTTFKVDRVIRQ